MLWCLGRGGDWSLDLATQVTDLFPAHASVACCSHALFQDNRYNSPMNLQVPIHLAKEFYSIPRVRRSDIVRVYRVIASTKSPHESYSQELLENGMSQELVDWFVLNVQKHGTEFDVITDSMQFMDESDYSDAKKWYEEGKVELDEKYRLLQLASLFYALGVLCAIASAKVPMLVLGTPFFSLLALWQISRVKASPWTSFPLNLILLIFAPFIFFLILSKYSKELAEDRSVLVMPKPSENFALVSEIGQLLRKEQEKEKDQGTIQELSDPDEQNQNWPAKKLELGSHESEMASKVINAQNAELTSVEEQVSAEGNQENTLAKLFELYRSGGISDAEFKELRSQFPD